MQQNKRLFHGKRSWFLEFVFQNSSQRDNFCLSEDLKMFFQGQFKEKSCIWFFLEILMS